MAPEQNLDAEEIHVTRYDVLKIQIIFSLNSKWVIFKCYRKKSIEK